MESNQRFLENIRKLKKSAGVGKSPAFAAASESKLPCRDGYGAHYFLA